mgnify:CR=1 FL=1
MKFIPHFGLGIKSYLNSVKFIFANHLWKYFIIPLILFGIIFYTGHYFEGLSDAAKTTIEGEEYSWGFIGRIGLWMKAQFYAFLKFLFLDATKYLVMIFLSPLLAIISEKTEEILTGNQYKFSLRQLIIDVKRGISIALRMLFVEFLLAYVLWNLLCKIMGWDTILTYMDGEDQKSFIYQGGVVLIGAYFYGFAYVDYINERLRLTIKESWRFMKRHAGLAFALGLVYSLFYRIPSMINTGNALWNTVLDNFGVLFAPVLAIVAATIAMHKLVDLNNSQFAKKSTLTKETKNQEKIETTK